MTAMTVTSRSRRDEAAVWARLERVDDPELDEPITAMGFVERVTVSDAGEVEVAFRLPTYWCSPNFAFLMTEDIHREVAALPWAARVRVRLQDHMWGEEIAQGVNAGRSFAQVFGTLADHEDLGELRAKLVAKAFKRRQEAVLVALRAQGWPDGEIVDMDLGTLDAVPLAAEASRQKARYRDLLIRRELATQPGHLAFRTLAGERLTGARLPAYLAELRMVRINMEFNGALCRGLARARYQEKTAGEEPTLVDFMLGRVPAAATN
jgi:metal-sulfur cluster biosynthetic enzyme